MSLLLRTFVLAAALAVSAGPAFAHAHLDSAQPPIDGSVSAVPSELDLTFSEAVDPAFTGVSVKGPAGAVATGPARLGPGGAKTLVVPLTGRLAPGAYRVDWHALAVDGHKTEGHYGFTVAP